MTPAQHLEKARRLVASGRYSLAGEFGDAAGREAYLAGYHTALAYILTRTGKEPKTHSGARSEFARLAREEPNIDQSYVAFLGQAYELKTVADYNEVVHVSASDVEQALDQATKFIEVIAALI
jgi:uncharacterized protein (UPF0332 family)